MDNQYGQVSYLKRNPSGNAAAIGLIVFFGISILADSTGIVKNAEADIIFLFGAISIAIGIASYFFLKRGNNNQLGFSTYEPRGEKIILAICGFIDLICSTSVGYSNYNRNLLSISIMLPVIWSGIILTRQWSFYKRLAWVIVLVLIIALVLGLKPQNF